VQSANVAGEDKLVAGRHTGTEKLVELVALKATGNEGKSLVDGIEMEMCDTITGGILQRLALARSFEFVARGRGGAGESFASRS
jgi:hypothetical protein